MDLPGIVTNPQIVHAIAAHFPIALAILGIPLVFLCAIGQMKNVTLRWLTFSAYAAMAVLSFLTVLTGEQAMYAVPGAMPPDIRGMMDTHEMLGENTWIFAAITGAFLLFCGVKSERLRSALTLLAMIMCLATGVWVAIAGYYGEMLVYKHGVGTPGPRLQAAAPSVTPPAAPAPPPQVHPTTPVMPTAPAPPSSAAVPGAPSATQAPAVANPQSVPPGQPVGLRPRTEGRATYMQRLQRTWGAVKNLVWPSN